MNVFELAKDKAVTCEEFHKTTQCHFVKFDHTDPRFDTPGAYTKEELQRMECFLDDLGELCRLHGIGIGDGQRIFLGEPSKDKGPKWLISHRKPTHAYMSRIA